MSCFAPWRGTVRGGQDLLPVVYSSGAPGWTITGCKTSSPSSPGAQLVVLAIGESGMVGADPSTAGLPVGYPSAGLRIFDKAHRCRPLTEPTHANTDAPVAAATVETGLVPGIGPAGLFCHHLAAETGANVALVPCAKGGSLAEEWLPGQPLYVAAIRRARLALQCGGSGASQLAYVIHEQGLNDAAQADGRHLQWAARWTAIETALRADLQFAGPWIYVRQHDTVLYSPTMIANWPAFLALQDGWASASRWKVQKPEGPWVDDYLHLSTSAQIELATRMAALIP